MSEHNDRRYPQIQLPNNLNEDGVDKFHCELHEQLQGPFRLQNDDGARSARKLVLDILTLGSIKEFHCLLTDYSRFWSNSDETFRCRKIIMTRTVLELLQRDQHRQNISNACSKILGKKQYKGGWEAFCTRHKEHIHKIVTEGEKAFSNQWDYARYRSGLALSTYFDPRLADAAVEMPPTYYYRPFTHAAMLRSIITHIPLKRICQELSMSDSQGSHLCGCKFEVLGQVWEGKLDGDAVVDDIWFRYAIEAGGAGRWRRW